MALQKGGAGKRRKVKRGKLAMLVGWVGTFSILAAGVATLVSPLISTLPALAGLLFPIGAILWSIGWLAAARSRRWKSLLFMSLVAGLNAPLFRATWGCGGCGMPAGSGEGLTVVSWNVRLFDFYGWLGDSKDAGGANGAKEQIMSSISEAEPDVLCLQEYFQLDPEGSFPVTALLDGAVGGVAHQHVVISRRKGPRSFGVATWSRWPIIQRSSIDFGPRGIFPSHSTFGWGSGWRCASACGYFSSKGTTVFWSGDLVQVAHHSAVFHRFWNPKKQRLCGH